jgi:DnaJ like chaperone protein
MFDFWNNEVQDCLCRYCDKENDCNNIYCIYCGEAMPTEEERELSQKEAKKFRKCKCENCGQKNNCKNKFCLKCGKLLGDSMSNEELYNHVIVSLDGIVIALLSKIAKIGGRIGKPQITFFKNSFVVLAKKRSQSEQIIDIYAQILDNEKRNLANIDTLCNKLASMKIMRDLKIEIIRLFVELAFIDGDYKKKQENVIFKIVNSLEVDTLIYQNIRHEFDPEDITRDKNRELSLKDCYQVLSITPKDPFNVVKRNYRKLVRQYHYDSLVSKDLPKDMLEFAEDKLKLINASYDMIKQTQEK